MIANCGGDEYGGISGGKAGDQGGEWAVIPWYSRPWDTILRYQGASTVSAEIARQARAAAQNNNIGYDQNERLTFWRQLKASCYDAAQIQQPCETDCSAGTAAIIKATGYRMGVSALQNVSADCYSGNIAAALAAAGFKCYTGSKYLTSDLYLRPGDILLLTYHHVAINLDLGSAASTEATTDELSLNGGTTLSRNPQYVATATTRVNVRRWAGVEHPRIKSWPQLSKGNLVDVCATITANNGAPWHYVRIAGKIFGFVNAKYLEKV